jgi:hypothetical protein
MSWENLKGKDHSEDLGGSWENNIKTGLREICENIDSVHLTQYMLMSHK